VDDAGPAGDGLTEGGRRQVADLDVYPHGAFPLFQQRQHGLAGRVLQKPQQPRRAQHRRHPPVGKIDRVPGLDDEPLLAARAHPPAALHRGSPCRPAPPGPHSSPQASAARRKLSRAVAAATPALTAETTPTRALSTSSPIPAARAFSMRPRVHTWQPRVRVTASPTKRFSRSVSNEVSWAARKYSSTSVPSYGMTRLPCVVGSGDDHDGTTL